MRTTPKPFAFLSTSCFRLALLWTSFESNMICNLQRFTPTRTPPATLVKSCHGSRTTNSSLYARLSVRIRHRSLSVAPRIFSLSGFMVIPASDRVEEEKWPWYSPRSFYPVRIGEVFQCRYQVLYKLGYGTTSTVWMCRDLR